MSDKYDIRHRVSNVQRWREWKFGSWMAERMHESRQWASWRRDFGLISEHVRAMGRIR